MLSRLQAHHGTLRTRPAYKQGAVLLGLGLAAFVTSLVPPNIPLLSSLAGPGGATVGVVLIGIAVLVLSPSGHRYVIWFRAFRQTRPFWGGVLLLVGGWLVLRLSMVSSEVVVVSGLTGLGGWLTGGGMILCGLAAWAAPSQRYVVGAVGVILAVTSLIVSNLGGLFVGMTAGILGGAMTLAWGPKSAPRPRRDRQFRVGMLGLVARPAETAPAAPARPPAAPAKTSAASAASIVSVTASTTAVNVRPRPTPAPRPAPRPSATRDAKRDTRTRA